MGHRNTGSTASNRSFKSDIRPRALMQTENTVLFRFNRVRPGKISSLREVLSDQSISQCCIDWLSWHGLSECGEPQKSLSLITRNHAAANG